MARLFFRAGILLLTAVLLVGCGRPGGPQVTAAQPAAPAPGSSTTRPAPSATLQAVLLPRATAQPVHIHLLEHRVTESAETGPTTQELELDLRASLKADKTRDDGSVEATLQFERIRLRMSPRSGSGAMLNYDSQTDKPKNGNPLADLMALVAGEKLHLHVGPDGRLLALRGLDPKWRAGGIVMAPPDLLAAQWLFRDMSMSELLGEALFIAVPAGPCRSGEKWEFDMPANIMLVARFTSHLRCTMDAAPAVSGLTERMIIHGAGDIEPAKPIIEDAAPAIRPFVEAGNHKLAATFDLSTGVSTQTSEREIAVALTLTPPEGSERLKMTIRQTRKLTSERGQVTN